MSSRIKTKVKFLNGDIIEVEHHKGAGEQTFRDLIREIRDNNKKFPYIFSSESFIDKVQKELEKI